MKGRAPTWSQSMRSDESSVEKVGSTSPLRTPNNDLSEAVTSPQSSSSHRATYK